jgi:uncharacterized protein
MKSSKYNLYIPYEDKIIVFNGISKKFIIIEKSTMDTFINYISNPNAIYNKDIIFQLEESGFILKNEINEDKVLFDNRNKILSAPYYTLMVLPTYNCNFKCWYCVQKHSNFYMNDDLINKIKKHITLYLIENKIEIFELAWFGGEPLLEVNTIVNICEFALDFCTKHNIVYKNSMTTNGFLITESIAKKMNKLNFSHFQITIDGCREKHNKVKYDKSNTDSAFDRTLKNITILLNNIPNASVLLRFNYTPNNLDYQQIVDEINSIIPSEVRNRIMFNLQKVWQSDEAKMDTNRHYNLKYLISKSGYKLSAVDLSNYYCCYVERRHYNSVFPNGNIVRCSNCDINKSEGNINEDGNIIWTNLKEYLLRADCMNCKFLPTCFGACPEKRFDNTEQQKNCKDEKQHFRHIVDYCESVILNN